MMVEGASAMNGGTAERCMKQSTYIEVKWMYKKDYSSY